jgi:hypothetical protein
MTVVDWILCLMCPLIALPITLIVLLVGNWVIKLFQ